MAAHTRQPNMSAYGASKAALIHWLEHIHFENQDRPRVHHMHPGIIRTDLLRDRGVGADDWKWENGMSRILISIGAKVMKALLPPGCKTSIQEKFLHLQNNQRHWTKETAEGGFDRAECSQRQDEASGDRAHWKAYRQLWMFALRHFPEMTGNSPRKDVSKPKPLHQSVENLWWYGITKLADLCGYKGIQTPYSTKYHADTEMAKAFLSSLYALHLSNFRKKCPILLQKK